MKIDCSYTKICNAITLPTILQFLKWRILFVCFVLVISIVSFCVISVSPCFGPMIFWIIPSACCFSIRLSMFVQLLAQETVFLIVDFFFGFFFVHKLLKFQIANQIRLKCYLLFNNVKTFVLLINFGLSFENILFVNFLITRCCCLTFTSFVYIHIICLFLFL